MKILMMSVRDDEKEAITEWEKRNNIEVKTVDWELRLDKVEKISWL